MNQPWKVIAPIAMILALAGCSVLRSTPKPAETPAKGDRVPTEIWKSPRGEVLAAEEVRAMKASFKTSLAYLKRGKTKKAQGLLEELSKSYNDQGAIFNALGIVYKKQGMLDEAVAAYQQAITLQNGFVEAHFNLGLAYRENGQFQEAEAEYKNAISYHPDFPQAHYNLGILYDLYMNRPADALRHYREYRRLAGDGNKMIKIWIKDLDRRVQSQMAKEVESTEGGGQ